MTKPGLTAYERVMRRTARTESGCLEFTGATRSDGYGAIAVGMAADRLHPHRMTSAHRVVFEHHNGPIPPGLFVLHRCDNPPCVEIGHLRLGTPLENTREMHARGRWKYHPPEVPQRGENNGRSKLTDEQVDEIRSSSESNHALARRFEISRRQVQRIKAGLSRSL